MSSDSTLTVADGSSINGNTASVSSCASVATKLIIDSRGASRRSIASKDREIVCDDRAVEDTLCFPARPLAERRRCLCECFHADCDERLEHRRQHRC